MIFPTIFCTISARVDVGAIILGYCRRAIEEVGQGGLEGELEVKEEMGSRRERQKRRTGGHISLFRTGVRVRREKIKKRGRRRKSMRMTERKYNSVYTTYKMKLDFLPSIYMRLLACPNSFFCV